MIIADVCSRLDVLANDVRAIEDFEGHDAALDDKIRLAVNDWLAPAIFRAGFKPEKHRTRWEPSACWASTGGAWVDKTADARGKGTAIGLATALAAPSTDAIYLGLDKPFVGMFVSLVDSINDVAIAASLTYWNGAWSALPSSLTNGTEIADVPFARAGRITWPLPDDWLLRQVNASGPYYWLRLQVNSIPGAACQVEQLLPIVRSRLAQPAALKALALTYREGAGGSRGDWLAKADAFEKAADVQLQMAVSAIADEFDVDDDGAVSTTEANSVAVEREPWSWSRG